MGYLRIPVDMSLNFQLSKTMARELYAQMAIMTSVKVNTNNIAIRCILVDKRSVNKVTRMCDPERNEYASPKKLLAARL